MTLDQLLAADVWRYTSAVVAVVVLFLLAVGITLHGHRLPIAWRVVLWAVVLQQAVIAYLETTRAVNTPGGYPMDRVDLPLAGIVVSLVALLLAVIGVFVVERREVSAARA